MRISPDIRDFSDIGTHSIQRNIEMQRDLLVIFRQCYDARSSRPQREPSHGPPLAPSESLDHVTSSLLSASKLLLGKYDSLNADSQQLEKNTGWVTRFKEDGEKLQGLLDYQSKRVYREIEAILEGKDPAIDHGPDRLEGNEAFWARFTSSKGNGQDGESDVSRAVGWVDTINKAHRAVTYLSKCFDMDEREPGVATREPGSKE